MLFDLTGKVSIVTGASKGIGKAIAVGLAEAGSHVVLCSRTKVELDEVAKEIEQKGVEALVIPCDVSNPKDIQNVVDEAVKKFHQIDVLINNAGITAKRPAEEYDLNDWNKVIGVNLTGVFLFAQAVGRQMIKQKKGTIINVSSVGGETALTGSIAYCASKGGVNMLTKVLAVEWAPHGIRVNGIAPAYIETPLVKAIKDQRTEFAQKVEARTPLNRLGMPDELIGSAIFLASDASSYITGETLKADGGWTALGL
ncbi:SDR family NAD(P)-dependent oxidoreductase [Neobacillus rhizophilus]|uniref:Glucose 1-dehydrogenase n=1 Tax=Neobacillus rhizophilus TaxID=2833579 RepID=A0A942UAH9_9BACI|nr:glucose 1-dehydrogenase [Neobacillus rhizophilus]MBS4215208.1 glucose 1-dehydrogenase [Neobacillus rhizophilus]